MHPGKNLVAPIIAEAHELFHGPGHIFRGVERLKEHLPVFPAVLVDKFHILFLEKGAVHEHDGTEIAGGGGADNITAKTVSDQTGDAARVIDVGMGKDEGIDFLALAEFTAVALKCLFAFSLKHAAVEHDGSTIDFNKMQRAGNGAGRPVEGDFHDFLLFLFLDMRDGNVAEGQ